MTARRICAALVAMLMVLSAACGGETAPTTTAEAPAFPSVVVDAWLDALVAGDYATVARHVEPVGAAIVLAAENDLPDDELAELIESGWTPELANSFWSSFRGDYALFAETSLGDLVVGRHTDIDVDGGVFARVRVEAGPDEGWIITRATDSGVWQIDLLATLGNAFAPLVRGRLESLGDGAAAAVILDGVAGTALGSLEAALAAHPDDARLETELVRIRQALEAR